MFKWLSGGKRIKHYFTLSVKTMTPTGKTIPPGLESSSEGVGPYSTTRWQCVSSFRQASVSTSSTPHFSQYFPGDDPALIATKWEFIRRILFSCGEANNYQTWWKSEQFCNSPWSPSLCVWATRVPVHTLTQRHVPYLLPSIAQRCTLHCVLRAYFCR